MDLSSKFNEEYFGKQQSNYTLWHLLRNFFNSQEKKFGFMNATFVDALPKIVELSHLEIFLSATYHSRLGREMKKVSQGKISINIV